MTKREGAIIGAYTGILCGGFSDLHRYIEGLLQRPVFTHELGDKDLADRISLLAKPEFLELAREAAGMVSE